MYTVHQMKTVADELSLKYWGQRFPEEIRINGRLTRSLGRCHFRRNNNTGEITPSRIELAGRLVSGNYSEQTIMSVLKHELCHWFLAYQEKPFRDGDPVFEAEIKRIGAHSTGIIEVSGQVYIAACSKCKKSSYSSNTKSKVMKYVRGSYSSGCCRAKLVYEEKYIEDQNDSGSFEDISIASIEKDFVLRIPSKKPYRKDESKVSSLNQVEVLKKENKTLIVPGKKGVTNAQMIPAMKNYLKVGDFHSLQKLKEKYPEIYDSSSKYLPKKYQALL